MRLLLAYFISVHWGLDMLTPPDPVIWILLFGTLVHALTGWTQQLKGMAGFGQERTPFRVSLENKEANQVGRKKISVGLSLQKPGRVCGQLRSNGCGPSVRDCPLCVYKYWQSWSKYRQPKGSTVLFKEMSDWYGKQTDQLAKPPSITKPPTTEGAGLSMWDAAGKTPARGSQVSSGHWDSAWLRAGGRVYSFEAWRVHLSFEKIQLPA